MSRLLLGSLFDGIAHAVAEITPVNARILEVGCGPGHLATRLAQQGFSVTAVDLDPAMITRAQTNSSNTEGSRYSPPDFQVGDVSELQFPDETFEVIVSALSMHHWTNPAAGLAEIIRVLKPGGRAVVWDFRPGLLHPHQPAAEEQINNSLLNASYSTPWHWPWRLRLLQRTELHRLADVTGDEGESEPAEAVRPARQGHRR